MPARPTRAAAGWALGALLTLAGFAFGQSDTFAELKRKDTRIVVTLKARSADGARFIGNNRNCEADVTTSLFYGPEPGYVDTLVDADTRLRSNVAIIRTPAEDGGADAAGGAGDGGPGEAAAGAPPTEPPGDAPNTADGDEGGGAAAGAEGEAADDVPPAAPASGAPDEAPDGEGGEAAEDEVSTDPAEQQTLELYNGTLVIGRPGCIESEDRADAAAVQLVQGRTTVSGTRFFLDRGADTGTMDGPITLARVEQGDSPRLDATADAMTLDTQDQHATLDGNVSVVSEDRTTTAATLELDEEAGVAVLTGSPARSVKGNDVLQGERLLYYLDSNDVVVLGNVHGELEFDLQ